MAKKNKKSMRKDPRNDRVQSGLVTTNPRKQIVKRIGWQRRVDVFVSESSPDVDDTFLPFGAQWMHKGINYRCREFYPSISQDYDCYRLDRVDVYAEYVPGASLAPVTIISCFDPDDSDAINWEKMSTRQNSKMTVLKLNEPKKLIASFAPVPNFNNTGAVGLDSPQNVVPMNRPWLDSAATNNSYNGLKVFATQQGDQPFSLAFHVKGYFSFLCKL